MYESVYVDRRYATVKLYEVCRRGGHPVRSDAFLLECDRRSPRIAIHLHGRLGPLAREDAAAAGRLLAPAARLTVVRVELQREEVGAGAASPAVAEPRGFHLTT